MLNGKNSLARSGLPLTSAFSLQPLAFFSPPRRQRADKLKKQQAAFFAYYAPEAREILNDPLKRYDAAGQFQFTLPDMLKVAPIWRHGSVSEIVHKCGGVDQLRNAVSRRQTPLYAR